MIKEIIATGKDIIEAKENARAALGVSPLDDVNFEIIHSGSKGIFGIIGVKPAQVRAYIEIPDSEEKQKRRHDRPKKERRPEDKPSIRRRSPRKRSMRIAALKKRRLPRLPRQQYPRLSLSSSFAR